MTRYQKSALVRRKRTLTQDKLHDRSCNGWLSLILVPCKYHILFFRVLVGRLIWNMSALRSLFSRVNGKIPRIDL
jgi:hypothetical protein